VALVYPRKESDVFGRNKTQKNTPDCPLAVPVEVSKTEIDSVFAAALNQGDYIRGLYALVVPGFAQARAVHGYPTCGAAAAAYIAGRAEAFDRRNEPGRAPGLGWQNYRWDVDWTLGAWEVSLAHVRVE